MSKDTDTGISVAIPAWLLLLAVSPPTPQQLVNSISSRATKKGCPQKRAVRTKEATQRGGGGGEKKQTEDL
jgi:hypothetical protein